MIDNVIRHALALPKRGPCPPELAKDLAGLFLQELAHADCKIVHHPLGFWCSNRRVSDLHSIRCHIWPTDWKTPHGQETGEVHDHSFELNSFVLLGAIRNEVFDVLERPDGDTNVLSVNYREGGSALSDTGRSVQMVRVCDDLIEAGTFYRLPAGVAHRGAPFHCPAASIVIARHGTDIAAPSVFVRKGLAPPTTFERKVVDEASADEVDRVCLQVRQLYGL